MHGHFGNLINYLLESSICLLAFHLLYVFLLKRNTFFQANRFYLSLTALIAFTIPLLHFQWQVHVSETPAVITDIPLSVSEATEAIKTHISQAAAPAEDSNKESNPINWLPVIYLSGLCIFCLRFIGRLYKIGTFIKIARQGDKPPQGMDTSSFFGHIFLHPRHEGEFQQLIWEHEAAHARQWHSLDIILIEILSVIHWFNPVIYRYQKNIRETHEFLADQHACKLAPSKYHYACILSGEQGRLAPSDISNHFASLIKKRLIMLSTKKSNRSRIFHYAAVIPMFIALLALFSFETTRSVDSGHARQHQAGDKYSMKWGGKEWSSNHFNYSIPYFSATLDKEALLSTQGEEPIVFANGERMTDLGEIFSVTVLSLDDKGEINKDPVVLWARKGSAFNSERFYSLVKEKIDRHGAIYVSKILARYRNEMSEFTDVEHFMYLSISDTPTDGQADSEDGREAPPHPTYGVPHISTNVQYLTNDVRDAEDANDPKYSPLTDQDKFTFAISDKGACMEGCQSSEDPYACMKERVKAFILANSSVDEKEDTDACFLTVVFILDEEGKVTKTHLHGKNDGVQNLSEKLGGAFTFSPAMHNGKQVKYYLEIRLKL